MPNKVNETENNFAPKIGLVGWSNAIDTFAKKCIVLINIKLFVFKISFSSAGLKPL